MRKRVAGCCALAVAVALAVSPVGTALAEMCGSVFAAQDTGGTVVINEVESSDADGGNDWIEIINTGTASVDIGGWYVTDDGGTQRLTDGETTAFAEGTTLAPGQLLVLEEGTNFDCGLGKADTASLYDASGNLVDTYSWTAHASGTYARVADGVGDFVDQAATKGTLNDPSVVVINEVESSDADGGNDWIEVMNTGTIPVYTEGWFVTDDGGTSRLTDGETTALAAGSFISAGGYYVFEETVDFTFGLGKADTASLYDASGNLIDTYSWTAHASGTYARVPDGTGEFVDTETATKGASNDGTTDDDDADDEDATCTVVINEVNSSPDDWIELYNTGDAAVDVGGYEIRDNSDKHRWQFAEGTSIEAGGFLVVEATSEGLLYDSDTGTYATGTFDIGLGSEDSVRLYDASGELVDSYSWTEHAEYDGDTSLASFGRYPDGTGSFALTVETKGAANEWYAPTVAINEVESSDDDGGADWVELYNYGDEAVDIGGWYVLDDDSSHTAQPLADGKTLEAGSFIVLEDGTDFDFGLGKADSITLYNADGTLIDSYTWSAHASGTYSRIPDGTGEFADANPTKGTSNFVACGIVLNEVESDAADDGEDWIELANPTDEAIDISGLVIADADGNSYTVPDGTSVAAGGYLVITQSEFGFELDASDGVYVYESGVLIASVEWTEHASVTLGLYPDTSGSEYRDTLEATPGAANSFDIPETISWPGGDDVSTVSGITLLADTSGLDCSDGQLYAIDNDEGTFWVFDIDEQTGALSYADGYEDGVTITGFVGSDGTSEAVADAEGITVTGDGSVYVAAERDNNNKGENYDVVMRVDAQTGAVEAQWDITDLLPSVSANYGIESVEWMSADAAEELLVDANTDAAFDTAVYPDMVGDGVFFVALEANGYVYALVLDESGEATVIATIDSQLGSAMALDYDESAGELWIVTDEAVGNMAARVTFDGTDDPELVFVEPPANMDTTMTNEGFAIVSACYATDGVRWVYRCQDGPESGQLSIGTLTATTGHTLVAHEAVAASCTQTGTEVYWECTACGKLFADEEATTQIDEPVVVAVTDHTAADAVVENETEATCTASGSYESVVYCSVCGEELSRESVEVEAIAHSFTDYVSNGDATCEADGTMTATCDNGCGTTDTVADEGSALGHDYAYDEGTWEWADDLSSATYVVACENDASHTLSYEADVELAYSYLTATYTASVEVEGETYTATETAETVMFYDVDDATSWYYDEIYALVAYGTITGYTDAATGELTGYYGVGDTMTRAQLATVIWRIACPEDYAQYQADYAAANNTYDCDNESGLSDVSDDRYYTAAVNWAVENGVITGYTSGTYAGKFRPNVSISFQDMCLVIARYAGGEDGSYEAITSSQAASTLSGFQDASKVSSYATAGMAWCVEAGLVSGYTYTSGLYLKPAQTVARERVATVIWRGVEAGLIG